MKKIILFLTIAILFSGCMSEIAKKNIPKINLPKEQQVKNITQHDDTLRCMDTLYRISGDAITVTIDNVKNETANKAKLPDNFKTMLLTAFSKLGGNVRVLPEGSTAMYTVKSAITEFDFLSSEGAGAYFGASGGKGKGETDGDTRGGYSKKVSTIAIDFNIVNQTGEQEYFEPYVSTSYKMKITSIDDSNDFGISIYGNGFGMNANVTKEQGIHGAIRLLLEISLSELLGELNALPYWNCRGGKYDRQYKDRVNYLYEYYERNNQLVSHLIPIPLINWKLLKRGETDIDSVNQAIIKFKEQNNILPINDEVTRDFVFKLLSTIPPKNNSKNSQSDDLFKKYSSIEEIKIYSQAMDKTQHYQDENYFEQNKKLDSVYRLYQTKKRLNPDAKLHMNSFVDNSNTLSNANKNVMMLYKKLIKKGINRRDMVKKTSKLSTVCTNDKNNKECLFKTSYILFNIN